ncbi:MAG: NAD(P)H-dependent oxidoreductase [Deferribacteraceae bacterium]|jgi:multimeric flavodoxin WrbA|nr:NAD(P)H-dependent oxidoreductase [Deferribacteraceae bacterium]
MLIKSTLLIECGSRKDGNGAYLADMIVEKYANENVKRVNLRDLRYSGCLACRKCKDQDSLCVQRDDLTPLFAGLAEVDRLVLIAPNYMGFVNGDTKQFTDRWYCMKDTRKISRFKEGAKLLFLFTQGSALRDHGDNAQHWMKRIADSYSLGFYGITVPNCAYDNHDGVRLKKEEIMMSISFFG